MSEYKLLEVLIFAVVIIGLVITLRGKGRGRSGDGDGWEPLGDDGGDGGD